MLRRLSAMFLPEGLVLLVATVLLGTTDLAGRAGPVLFYIPPAIAALGVAIAWRFRQAGVAVSIVAVALAAAALERWPGIEGSLVLPLIALLLPANFLLWGSGLLPAHRGGGAGALARLGALAAQAGLVVLVMEQPHLNAWWAEVAARVLTPGGVTLITVVAFAHGTAMVVFAARALLLRQPIDRGYLWAAAASALAVTGAPTAGPGTTTAFLATAGLLLLIALVESSYSLAYRDGLTGLPSRRALDEALNRTRGAYTIAMVDIDHFKRCNDRHGHEVGDQVLRKVASILESVGGGGRAYRYGGEEFAVLFSGTSLEDAAPHLEALRRSVEAAAFTIRGSNRPKKKPRRPAKRRGERLAVTVSIGVAARNGRALPVDQVVQAADAALYKAKRRGRNRLVKDTSLIEH